MELLSHPQKSQFCLLNFQSSHLPQNTVAHFEQLLQNKNIQGIVIDFRGISNVGFHGLSDLVLIFAKLETEDIRFAVCQMNRRVLDLLQMACLDNILPIFPTEEAAYRHLLH